MLFSYIVYTLLALVVCSITYYVWRHYNVRYSVLLIPSLCYALLVGMRYDTGADWFSYHDYYLDFLAGRNVDLEFAYVYLNKAVAFWGLKYQMFFIIVALIQIGLLYKFLENRRGIWFWGVLLYFLIGPFFSSLNLVRQSLAFFVFLYSLRYIENREGKKYVVAMVLAFGFHTSSLVLAPLYFVNRIDDKHLEKRSLLLGLFALTILLGTTLMEQLGNFFFEVVDAWQYQRYASGFLDNSFSYGLGFVGIKLIDAIMICYAVKLNRTFKKEGFAVIWWIYYIGVLIFNMGMANQLTIRMSYCMTSLRFVILSYLCCYVFSMVKCKTKLVSIVTICILIFCVMTFYGSIAQGHNGCSPFQFAL